MRRDGHLHLLASITGRLKRTKHRDNVLEMPDIENVDVQKFSLPSCVHISDQRLAVQGEKDAACFRELLVFHLASIGPKCVNKLSHSYFCVSL